MIAEASSKAMTSEDKVSYPNLMSAYDNRKKGSRMAKHIGNGGFGKVNALLMLFNRGVGLNYLGCLPIKDKPSHKKEY